jgi:hypothetical protein
MSTHTSGPFRPEYFVTCLWRVEAQNIVGLPICEAMMALDAARYPTPSRIKRAVRKGTILRRRPETDTETAAQAAAAMDELHSEQPGEGKMTKLVHPFQSMKTSDVVKEGDTLALQVRMVHYCVVCMYFFFFYARVSSVILSTTLTTVGCRMLPWYSL